MSGLNTDESAREPEATRTVVTHPDTTEMDLLKCCQHKKIAVHCSYVSVTWMPFWDVVVFVFFINIHNNNTIRTAFTFSNYIVGISLHDFYAYDMTIWSVYVRGVNPAILSSIVFILCFQFSWNISVFVEIRQNLEIGI